MTTLSEATLGSSLDIRVEDFLDDKLQSTADLDSLDELVANVETQRSQLQSQLDDAVKELEEARDTAQNRQGSLQTRIDEFNKLQESIDMRVKVAAASDAPSEAIARLQKPIKLLQAVDMAQKYLNLLQDVERLRAEARSHLPGSPKAALEPYTRLKEMAIRLRSVQGSEELHLVDHVKGVTESLWGEMERTMSAELDAVLDKRHWPRVDPQSEMDEEWVACVEKLLDLQMPEVIHSATVVSLLPFDVMAKMFVAEFRFHFLSEKPTSSLQSVGTHCFPWFMTTIEKWEDFVRDNLGPLLAAKFRDTPVATKMVYLDPVCALVTAMLPVMREKIHAVALQATQSPSFFSSFMSLLMTLDDNIRSRFNYDGGDPDNGWPGLSADVLDNHFDDWFQVERGLALERFEQTMESHDARKIDYDYAVGGKMKPTFAAVRTTDLLRAVTTRYERLRKLKHKIRFLTDIQLDILDGYHDRLRGSLEAYQSITSTLGRTLHGATREQLTALEGTGALEILCKVIGSADHVANTLAEWSDEEFFAILWEELQARDTQRNQQGSLVDTVERDDIKGHVPRGLGDGENDGIFDETVAAYAMRRKGAEELLIGALADSHSKAFRAYLNHVQWTTVGEAAVLDDPLQLSITPELDEPLRILKRNLDFLSKALSTASFRRVWHDALDKLQETLWNNVLLRQSFTTLGAAQFAHDGAALFSLVDRYIPGGSSALEALREGLQLLNLPASVEAAGWPDGTVGVTLKDASDRAFTDNDEARRVLEELGLEALTPLNARYILQRRIENNENIGW
ncbi:RAD50-interacting protein 1 [Tolypocladium capitatum]|uniref:RAD50-interacting protein 1 n=1 Tax=Tolypocladium capitatum TaxID=45235 RepID=A0A2K3QQI7_9HYPO|nr:RAD50-interacting protein 1 [Tolypocladium capitatum]